MTTPRTFCTLFDRNFLGRALALHQSLIEQCPDFSLWILCMDDESYDMLEKLKLANVHLLRLAEVEDSRMLAVKPTHTPVEYCWMFSSALPLYILEKNPRLDMITYLDADLYFYASPDPIYQEFGMSSILLIPHGYSTKHEHREKLSGTYNVGMMIFRNDANGLEALRWWKDRVIEWCFNRYEDGKFGDQLYLNDWPTRFKGVHILEHLGANVASWNISRARLSRLIFYHFHSLKIYAGLGGAIRAYPITMYDQRTYKQYLRALNAVYSRLRAIDPAWDFGLAKKLDILRVIKQYISLWLRKKS